MSLLGAIRPSVPLLLTVNGGFVDASAYLALQGLFTAHVTGNFVTLGAALISGTSGTLGKILALPVFCASIVMARLTGHLLRARGLPVLRVMLVLEVALLAAAALLAIRFGPFQRVDTVVALLTGQLMVAAMAIQNATHRVHLAGAPPSTIMTSTTTQMMIDLADLLRAAPAETKRPVRERFRRTAVAVLAFAAGCAAGALTFARLGMPCFVIPPLLGIVTMLAPTSD